MYRSKRVLISGGQGFVGSLLSNKLRNLGIEVHSNLFDVRSQFVVENLMNEFQPDVIVHLASPTDLGECEEHPELASEVIVGGTKRLIESTSNACQFIFASSSLVYKQPEIGKTILDETWELAPKTSYGKLKLLAEENVAAAVKRHHILRIFPHTHKSQHADRFLSRSIQQLKRGEEFQRNLMNQGRDMGAVSDLVAVFVEIINKEILPGIYNVCTGRARCLGNLVSLLAEHLEVPVRFTGTEGEDLAFCGSYLKLNEALGWTPQHLTDMDFINYYLSDEASA